MAFRIIGLNLAFCFLLLGLCGANLNGQQGGLPPGVTPGDLESDILDAVNDAGGPAADGNTGTTGGGGFGDGGGFGEGLGFEPIEVEVNADMRSQRGFVGVSLQDPDSVFPEYRFVGANSDTITTNSSSGGGGIAGRNAGGDGTGNTNGFNVDRTTPIRSRVVRAFRAPTIAPVSIANRVNRRLSSLPATRQFSDSMDVAMRGRTAVISGTARSQTQIDRVKRQLRLEPGVSRIETQVRLIQGF